MATTYSNEVLDRCANIFLIEAAARGLNEQQYYGHYLPTVLFERYPDLTLSKYVREANQMHDYFGKDRYRKKWKCASQFIHDMVYQPGFKNPYIPLALECKK